MTNQIIGVISSGSSITADVGSNAVLSTDIQVGHTHANKQLLDKITEIAADKFFAYEQTVSSKLWSVDHGLNKYPSITVVDSAGSVVIGEVIYVSLNSVLITFVGEFMGKAYFN